MEMETGELINRHGLARKEELGASTHQMSLKDFRRVAEGSVMHEGHGYSVTIHQVGAVFASEASSGAAMPRARVAATPAGAKLEAESYWRPSVIHWRTR